MYECNHSMELGVLLSGFRFKIQINADISGSFKTQFESK